MEWRQKQTSIMPHQIALSLKGFECVVTNWLSATIETSNAPVLTHGEAVRQLSDSLSIMADKAVDDIGRKLVEQNE